MRKAFFWFVGAVIAGSTYAEDIVSNVVAAQIPGTKNVEITYDVESTETNAVKVYLSAKNGTVPLSISSVSGDVGEGVPTGADKVMTWDMGQDWSGNVATLSLTVSVDDGIVEGGDPSAVSWEVLGNGLVQNHYANGDITVSDLDENLMWPRNAVFNTVSSWSYAKTSCADLAYADYSNWRLPEKDELAACDYVFWWGWPGDKYWSNTQLSETDYGYAYSVSESGHAVREPISWTRRVWPIRSLTSGNPADPGQTIHFYADSRDYILTVSSDHGTPVPGVGANAYAWKSTITCSVDVASIDDGINGHNTGWTGTGAVPASGTTNTTGAITLTNLESSITWNWIQVSALIITNVVAEQRSGTKYVDVSYDLISSLSNSAPISLQVFCGETNLLAASIFGDVGSAVSPGTHKSIAWDAGSDWDGNADILTLKVMHTAFTNLANTATEYVDSRDYTLAVSSDHGYPVPNIGNNTYAWKSTITCSVDTVVAGTLTNRLFFSGWAGSGSVPSSGTTSETGPIVLTNLESSITWLWTHTVKDLWAENVSATQRPGTKLVDISYDLYSAETNTVDMALSVSNAQGSVSSTALNGDVGSGVSTGTARTVVWDAGADWDGNLADLTFRLSGQYAPGVHVETPAGRVRVPAGKNSGVDPDFGAYSVIASNSLFMDASEITKGEWDTVYNWALTNDYTFANVGSGLASNHPVQSISWYDAAKWCNARSEMEGFAPCYNTTDWSCDFSANGYRLPTAEEWQYAARGGLSGKRFPWGNEITHFNANYISSASYTYDVSATRSLHPIYGAGTAPESSGTTNGYGLYAMAGNVREWSNDSSGENRVLCGGRWQGQAPEARCATESFGIPSSTSTVVGFRTVRLASFSDSILEVLEVGVDTRDYLLMVSSEHGSPITIVITNDLVLDAGLIAYYPFDGNANDASANGHDGVASGVTATVGVDGVEGHAYHFNGSNSKITIPDHPDFTVSNVSVAAWVRSTDKSGHRAITSCYETDGSAQWYHLYYLADSGIAVFRVDPGGVSSPFVTGISDIADGEWHYVVGVRDISAGKLYVYVDGVLEGTQEDVSSEVLNPGAPVLIGAHNTLTDRYFNGDIDEVRIYGRALSSNDVIGLMAEQSVVAPIPYVVADSSGVTNTYAWRSAVACSVGSPVISGQTNWTSVGWSGTGSAPSLGRSTNTGAFVLTGLVSSITWNWNTNYWVEAVASGEGQVAGGNVWVPSGSNATVTASASNGWLFMGWSGDASGDYSEESIILPVVRPVSVTASFSDDADDDGLLNTNETALGTDPRKKDSDGDGSDDSNELIAGTSPTNSVSVLAVNLAFESFANELSFFGVSGRYYQIEYTGDLGGTWTPLGMVSPGSDAVISEYDFTAGEKRFYRIRVSDNPDGL